MRSVLIDARLSWASGIGRYAANLAPRVAAAMPDCTFDLLVRPDVHARAEQLVAGLPNIRVTALDIPPFSMAEQVALPRLGRSYDLTWFTNYWVPLAFRHRYVAAVHDMLHLEPALFPASAVKRALSRRTFAHVRATARGVFYASRFTEREFKRRFGAPRDSVVSGYGIDHLGWQLFDPATPPAKERSLLVVAAGKFHKNFRIAIEAFGRARIDPRWKLTVIVPDQALRSSIDVERLVGSADRIVFRQGVSNDELRTIYGAAALLLMPSFYEGFGLPLAEGMQAGAQCISSTAEALVEVGQGAQVTFVNPRDLIGWTLAIEAECRRFDEGRVDGAITRDNMRHASGYRWEAVTERTVGLLTRAL